MTRYLTQCTMAPQAVAASMQNPQNREEVIGPLIESLGGKLEHYWIEVGGDQAYIVVEWPDTESMGLLNINLFAAGIITSMKTSPIMTAPESVELIKKAAEVAYEPPSA